MKYVDYDLDLSKEKIVLDKEITLEKLDWHNGDYFKVKEEEGRIELIRVDPLVKFIQKLE